MSFAAILKLISKYMSFNYWFQLPSLDVIFGLLLFFIGIKLFSGGVKSYGDTEWLKLYMSSPALMFVGSIGCTLIWQSSSLTTATIVTLVSAGVLPLPSAIAAVLGANIGTTVTIWIAGFLNEGLLVGNVLRISIAHTVGNLVWGLTALPFVHTLARYLERIG